MTSKKIVIGVLAHVDSGKTTLIESILYKTGSIRCLGRVDHKNTFLDNNAIERDRGITIFSKQAIFNYKDVEFTLLDTPGHVDFSAEMERTLSVLDYAILVVSASDGIQGHTQTLWNLLLKYNIPAFVFINKMDQNGIEKKKIYDEIIKELDDKCIDFCRDKIEIDEDVALCDEQLMNEMVENGYLEQEKVNAAIADRKVYPVYFGSALKQDGVEEFLEGMYSHLVLKKYPEEFGARVYKIIRDEQGNRVTYLKVTGGELKARDVIKYNKKRNEKVTVDYSQENDFEELNIEKVNQIRVYSGSQYNIIQIAEAGSICAITGLTETFAGQGLGNEKEFDKPILNPALTYQVKKINSCDSHTLYMKLRQLEEEEPELHVKWNSKTSEISVMVMGEVQIEILKKVIFDKYKVEVDFELGSVLYKETIKNQVVGIGHYEPLRHYAEVHLLLEPLERGQGLEFCSDCSEDKLDKNWQRLVITHLAEKNHKGVLGGFDITDMRITLVAGRNHIKHTEGGDFRQATYRAVRHGLKNAESILLEPVYKFQLEIPNDQVGRALTDIQKMSGCFEPPHIYETKAIIKGTCPVVTMKDYYKEVIAYTSGYGKLICIPGGYEECHNQEEVLNSIGYDSESDLDNPTGSVFCSHGAGVVVPWDKVSEYAHVNNGFEDEYIEEENNPIKLRKQGIVSGVIDQEEIDEIFERTFGAKKQKRHTWAKTIVNTECEKYIGKESSKINKNSKEYLLVDGYNIIFSWEELKELAKQNIDSARDKLMDILCNYQGYKKCELILVFDAYKVSGGKGEIFDYNNIHVVYTKEAETADQYIEKVTHVLVDKHSVTVATSDKLEQMIIWGAGAKRLSSMGLYEEIKNIDKEINSKIDINSNAQKNYLGDYINKKDIRE